jgi:uncharacterized membrane protein YeaQ/YmgE (transglycosylase-associated protein family)
MSPIVWCVIGAVVGWLATVVARNTNVTLRIESVLVGVFGAFVGGEFLASMLLPAVVKGAGIAMPAVGLSVGCALVAVFLLAWMRKSVGPLKVGKKRSRS